MKWLVRSVYSSNDPRLKRNIFGLEFTNPVGLAAGFDKDAKLIDELACFGFGHIEIGTLTPKEQVGNQKPRLFRLPEDRGLINRMGFNNHGVIDAVNRLRRRTSDVLVGGNIGKNKDVPNERAVEDYEYCFEALYDHVDYFVVNVSSPNTPDLRELQDKDPLRRLLSRMKDRIKAKNGTKPILLKIAPDLNQNQLDDIVEIALETKIDGLIATNTTIGREGLLTPSTKVEQLGSGGLSGAPLTDKSTEVIRYLSSKVGDNLVIIGVGGITTPQDAIDKLKAGATLVQIYTGFIYEGPSFIKRINRELIKQGLES